ncbi:hypothetical protein [Streptomyces luteireticuli]|uniref:hypothetical protein n=1 Tax=Streptomyces luteireticuli TaxID=173858 RepID=UPI00355704C5
MSADQERPEPGMNQRVKQFLFPSRQTPSRNTTQAEHVRDRKYGGNIKAMAASYGVAPRTVYRWLDGSRHPVKHAERLQREAAEVQTTPRGRERRARELEQRGAVSGVRARVGRTTSFNIRGSDAVRTRDIYLTLSGEQAAELARAENEDEVRQAVAKAVADYFNSGSPFGGWSAQDFDFDPHDFDLT